MNLHTYQPQWYRGKGEMPQPTWDAVLMTLGVNTEEEEQYGKSPSVPARVIDQI
jgi:hypothetical protein